LLIAALVVSSCGGGGGDASTQPSVEGDSFDQRCSGAGLGIPVPTGCLALSTYTLANINQQTQGQGAEYTPWLRQVNAPFAHEIGATGAGQKLLVVDTGLLTSHQEFSGSGKASTASLLAETPAPPRDELDHGTAIAGVAVANRDSDGMMGVAPDADVHLAYVPLGSPGGSYSRFDLDSFDYSEDVRWNRRAVQEAVSQGASVINYSFGYDGAISLYDADEVRRAFRDSVEEVRQALTHHANRKIFVLSAGNSGLATYADGTRVEPEVYASPDIDAGLGVYFEGLDLVLAVVALKQ